MLIAINDSEIENKNIEKPVTSSGHLLISFMGPLQYQTDILLYFQRRRRRRLVVATSYYY